MVAADCVDSDVAAATRCMLIVLLFGLPLTFLILDLLLDALDGVAGLDVQRDGLTRQGLDEDLHRHDGRGV